MKEKLLRMPEGVRDICGAEFIIKDEIEKSLKDCMKKFGFLEIKTPAFEYFDIFNSERGTVSSKDMYKFTDREGETLVLRPDITPQIARFVSKCYQKENLPIRLFYHGNTFVNNNGYQGKLKEITQVGAELVNEAGPEADAEMIALMITCLKNIGLKEFKIEIGNAGFFKGISEMAGFSEEETNELRALIEKKNIFGVEELLKNKELDPVLKKIFSDLPLQFGSIDFVKGLYEKVSDEKASKALKRLLEVYDILKYYELTDYVSFDLGMLSQYDYYTGIVFKAYTYKTGEPVAAGGRYDKLLGQFGKPAPAIGIAIYSDYAITALQRQQILHSAARDLTLVLYEEEFKPLAIKLASLMREDGLKISLVRKEAAVPKEEYIEYARSILAGGITIVNNHKKVSFLNVLTMEVVEKEIV